MQGWQVDPLMELPEGYELREDSAFCYLYRGDRLVVAFGPNADPGEILREAQDDRRGMDGR